MIAGGETIDALARVEIAGVKEDVRSVSRDLHSLRDTAATKADINSLGTSIANLSNKHDQLRQPQYSLVVSMVGLTVGILATLGGFALWPIREGQNDLKDTIKTLAQGVVYQRRYDDNNQRVYKILDDIREHMVDEKTFRAIIADRDARLNGNVRRLERLENRAFGLPAN